MEVFVSAPNFRFSNLMFPDGSVVRDVLNRVVQQQGLFSSGDFYIIRNGQRSGLDNPLQHGAVYHLEPRLCGGKGGFGSMLRALGAQIEKTTNREACRDLSGRRLRDVNHEKEMAEWLKKQAEREAEKEQRRLERLQRKLSEPKHQFTDLEYQQQCHNLSERLEDSVIKGLQASSGSQVRADDASATKRPSSDQSEQLHKKKKKAAACFWTGVDELLSSEDEDEDENEDNDESPSTSSSCGAAAVTRMTQTEEVEPDQSSSSSPASECSSSLAPQTATPEEAGLRAVDEGQSREEVGLRSANEGQSHGEESLRSADEGQSHEEEGLRAPDEGQGPAEGQRPVEASRDHPVIPTEDPEAFKTSESSCSSQQQQEDRSLLDLSSLSSVDQLESLGLDVLKQELVSRGLKCGGTLTERATRLFSIRGLTPDQIDPVLLVKPGKTMRK